MSIREIPFTTMADGTDLKLNICEITGKNVTGPTVAISAGIHGDESTGTKIILDLF